MATSSNSFETRKFICGNCYGEYPTLSELTFHADFCFATNDQQNQPSVLSKPINCEIPIVNHRSIPISPHLSIPISSHRPIPISPIPQLLQYFRPDEPAVVVETLGYNGNENDFLRPRSTGRPRSSIHQPITDRSIFGERTVTTSSIPDRSNLIDQYLIEPLISRSNPIDLHRCDSDSAGNFLIDDSAQLDEQSSQPRIRGKHLSLAGIRVTAGLNIADDSDHRIPDQTVEYRGSGARIRDGQEIRRRGGARKTVDLLDEDDQHDLGDFGEDPVAMMDESIDSDDLGPNIPEISTNPIRSYPHNVKYKQPCTGPRQKWRYRPTDSESILLPDGRLKKSYRIHCPVCDRILWRQNLHQHMRVHNGQRPYVCQICSKPFSSSADLKKHTITHEDQSKRMYYQCPFCPWNGLGGLRRHVKSKHEGMELDMANVVTRRRTDRVGEEEEQLMAVSAIPNEMEEEGDRRAENVVEEVCQAVFSGTFTPPDDQDLWTELIDRVEQDLRRDPQELVRNWRPTMIECNICWRIIRRSNYPEHRQIHDGQHPFACQRCSKSFRFQKRLLQHVNIEHNGDGEWHSCHCGVKFGTATKLWQHRRLKHGKSGEQNTSVKLPWKIRKSICYVCGLMITQSKMAAHLKVHREGDRFHQCDQCPRKYRSAYFLRLHKAKAHEGYLPYKCLKCPYRAVNRDRVVSHMLEIHQELIDSDVILIDGITTLNHLPTRKCPICHVHIFVDNFDTHQIKHNRPEDFQTMKNAKEEAFRMELRQQRRNRVDGNGKQSGEMVGIIIEKRVKTNRRTSRKMNQFGDHDYLSSGKKDRQNSIIDQTEPTSDHGNLRRSSRIRIKTQRFEEAIDQEIDIDEPMEIIDQMDNVSEIDSEITIDQQLLNGSIAQSDQQSSIIDPVSLEKESQIIQNPISSTKETRFRYQCLLCKMGFENIASLIIHDHNHHTAPE